MSKQITITVPDKVYESLIRVGLPLEEGPSDVVKRNLMTAYTTREGAWLKLEPVEDPRLKDHPQLPLGDCSTQ
jgi:hypothetical protein